MKRESSFHPTAIRIKDVTRRFGGQVALAGVDLEIESGEIHALLGTNGAGKTTLMKLMAGLMTPSSGTVEILGGTSDDRTIRSRIGWVPSVDRSFYLRVSGLENLLFFARMYGVTKSRARRRAVELLDAVGLSDHGSKRAGLYSHGMLKRLAVARALISEPDVLLLDEATHDLDPLGSAEIRSLVSNIASQGGAIVWATQRLAELRDFADRVTVLQDGLTRFAGSVPELISRAALRSFRLRFANPLSVGGASMPPGMEFESLAADDSVLLHLSAEVSLGEALDHIRQQGLVLVSCTEATSEVETAFLELTTKEGAR